MFKPLYEMIKISGSGIVAIIDTIQDSVKSEDILDKMDKWLSSKKE